jgi:hypothetical protein
LKSNMSYFSKPISNTAIGRNHFSSATSRK